MQLLGTIESLQQPADVLLPTLADLFVRFADRADTGALMLRLLHACVRHEVDLGESTREAFACCVRHGDIAACALAVCVPVWLRQSRWHVDGLKCILARLAHGGHVCLVALVTNLTSAIACSFICRLRNH